MPARITIAVDDEHLVIGDNGAGIPPDVVKRICDFNSRTSDKAAYVSPSRGAMGNGSKLILAIPFALNRQGPSTTTIEACDVLHTIVVLHSHLIAGSPTPVVHFLPDERNNELIACRRASRKIAPGNDLQLGNQYGLASGWKWSVKVSEPILVASV